MPLGLMQLGEQSQIRSVQGSPEVSRRLTNLGFTAGTPVSVVGKSGAGIIVCVRDCRVALDCGMACCIQVG